MTDRSSFSENAGVRNTVTARARKKNERCTRLRVDVAGYANGCWHHLFRHLYSLVVLLLTDLHLFFHLWQHKHWDCRMRRRKKRRDVGSPGEQKRNCVTFCGPLCTKADLQCSPSTSQLDLSQSVPDNDKDRQGKAKHGGEERARAHQVAAGKFTRHI